MYYYRDCNAKLRGPFPEQTLEKWFENDELPMGTMLVDLKKQQFKIEDVMSRRVKPRVTKKVYFDESTFADRTMDETNLDVTLDLNHTYQPNDSTMFQPDFTQLSEGVDEVDSGKGAESDTEGANLQRAISLYVDRRALINRRRQFADCYVPFEFTWSKEWIPQPLSMSDAFRGAVHLHNLLQELPVGLFSDYLRFINIHPHPCYTCHVDFETAKDMMIHFCSVVHVRRLYTQSNPSECLSMIDVHCVQKMLSDVELLGESCGVQFEEVSLHKEPNFFDDVDIGTAVESLKSTLILMQSVPLLSAPKMKEDVCEYIEAITLFRALDADYHNSSHAFRSRRLGVGIVHCSYCHVDLDGTLLESMAKHLLSERHIQNSLSTGISRSAMEYWISFFGAMHTGQSSLRNSWRYHQKVLPSLQETDFPLCYKLTDLPQGDFVYKGAELEPVLNEIRSKVREHYSLLSDHAYRTTCRWCHVDLYSEYGVLRHVLYDKTHLKQLEHISNDDLRRLLKVLRLEVAMPLFKPSTSRHQAAMNRTDKMSSMQKLRARIKRVAERTDSLNELMFKSFPMGLVNYCELCHVEIEHVNSIIDHFCSKRHSDSVINSRITESDIACWMEIFSFNFSKPSRNFRNQ